MNGYLQCRMVVTFYLHKCNILTGLDFIGAACKVGFQPQLQMGGPSHFPLRRE
ncbi:hypothetical protein Q5A_004505 [Serratia inhibens PRI-2C]|nr:hypothetical protein Q5A_004505 [Serratia inhibens PRI-2C]